MKTADLLATRRQERCRHLARDAGLEEIVGASATQGWTHNFATAEALGLQVLEDMAATGKLA